jgi:hypothetical protein
VFCASVVLGDVTADLPCVGEGVQSFKPATVHETFQSRVYVLCVNATFICQDISVTSVHINATFIC